MEDHAVADGDDDDGQVVTVDVCIEHCHWHDHWSQHVVVDVSEFDGESETENVVHSH